MSESQQSVPFRNLIDFRDLTYEIRDGNGGGGGNASNNIESIDLIGSLLVLVTDSLLSLLTLKYCPFGLITDDLSGRLALTSGQLLKLKKN